MLSIIIMIVGGLVAAMGLITKIAPSTKSAFEKIVRLQGLIGLVLVGWSVYTLIQFIQYSIFDLVTMVMLATQFLVGFLLSFSLLSKFLFKTEQAQNKGQNLRNKLINFQIPLGLALTAFGIWNLLQTMML